jgi:prolyl-tRNA synthetase
MKYRDLQIQTQREAPNNARTEGFSFLVRAGYLTRDGEPTLLGQSALDMLKKLRSENPRDYFTALNIPIMEGIYRHIFFPTPSGRVDLLKCNKCDYADRVETAIAQYHFVPVHEMRSLEKVYTPECSTIEALAKLLHIETSGTAKAMMFVRKADEKFVFIVLRGDTQLNLHKLTQHIGDVRPATIEEIQATGAAPGYASPIGIKNALVIVDSLIPRATNLVAGANEPGYHLLNTNYGRDYSADMVLDLVQVEEGDICAACENSTLDLQKAEMLVTETGECDFNNILLALAETHHDEKGLTLPHPAAPFDVYLMHVPGKELDTRAKAEEIYNTLQKDGISVLFDDRNERAGVKFNDADLIGCPVRMTVGEKGLKEGMVELKPRKVKENQLVPLDEIVEKIKSILN